MGAVGPYLSAHRTDRSEIPPGETALHDTAHLSCSVRPSCPAAALRAGGNLLGRAGEGQAKSWELCFCWQGQCHLSQKYTEVPEQGWERSRGGLAAAESWFSPRLGQILLPQLRLRGRQWEKLVGCWHDSMALHVQR